MTTANRALTLYRSILRAHTKYLPQEMKGIGDSYVKSEFRLHKDVTSPEQLQQFFVAWDDYLDQLLATARARETVETGMLDKREDSSRKSQLFEFGRDLPKEADLSEEQLAQLEKLKLEATKAGKPTSR